MTAETLPPDQILTELAHAIEAEREEVAERNKRISDLYKRARGHGFDLPSLKAAIRKRAMLRDAGPAAVKEIDELTAIYLNTISSIETRSSGESQKLARDVLRAGARTCTRVHAHEGSAPAAQGGSGKIAATASGTVAAIPSPVASGAETAAGDDLRIPDFMRRAPANGAAA